MATASVRGNPASARDLAAAGGTHELLFAEPGQVYVVAVALDAPELGDDLHQLVVAFEQRLLSERRNSGHIVHMATGFHSSE